MVLVVLLVFGIIIINSGGVYTGQYESLHACTYTTNSMLVIFEVFTI